MGNIDLIPDFPNEEKLKPVEREIITKWTKKYIDMTISENKNYKISEIIKSCSIEHFNAVNMQEVLEKYVGKVEEFIEFIQNEWKWKITFNKENGIIIADENKNYCVCPLVKMNLIKSKKLCLCSEGFGEKMFSYILKKTVKAKVIRSFLRDGKSCIYKIIINP